MLSFESEKNAVSFFKFWIQSEKPDFNYTEIAGCLICLYDIFELSSVYSLLKN